MDKVAEVRERTYNDLIDKLDKFGKCALIRCTSFGKTYMMTKLSKRYKKILYLYPLDCVKQMMELQASAAGLNIVYKTYYKLARDSKSISKDEYSGYDLIIADECHRMGARKTRAGVRKVLRLNKGAHFVGATATPDRQDGYDILGEFFDNTAVFEYTIHDAFTDGVIMKPYYVYCTGNFKADICKSAKEAGISKDELQTVLDSKLVEVANIYGMSPVIKRTCLEALGEEGVSYMKFIVFFQHTKHMEERGSDVCSWFKEAFPDHSIHNLIVRSDKEEYHSNVDELGSLKCEANKIDLIFCIDMLNEGYHVEDLTGVVLYRGTKSGRIFIQQLGRALSAGTGKSAIVFDVVDNLHRKAIYYDMQNAPARARSNFKKLADKRIKEIEEKENRQLTVAEKAEIYDKVVEEYNNQWWHKCNDMTESDFIISGHKAEYEEYIKKLVEEPLVARIELCYKEWIRRGGQPEPRTALNWLNPDGNNRVPLPAIAYVHYLQAEAVAKYYGVK